MVGCMRTIEDVVRVLICRPNFDLETIALKKFFVLITSYVFVCFVVFCKRENCQSLTVIDAAPAA